MNGVTWSYFPCSRGPGPSSQASKGWISSKWAPLGWRSGKGEGKQRELRALRRLEIGKLKMFDLIPVNDVNFWEQGLEGLPKPPLLRDLSPGGWGRTQHGGLGGRAGI